MADAFVPLGEWLAPPEPVAVIEVAQPTDVEIGDVVLDEPLDLDALFGEVRRFRAALAESLESARAVLVHEIAVDVVGRELEVGDVDLRSIVKRACERYSVDAPLRVRVHPADAGAVRLAYPVIEDDSLRRGDAVVELSSGTIDARLGVRLDRVLRSLA